MDLPPVPERAKNGKHVSNNLKNRFQGGKFERLTVMIRKVSSLAHESWNHTMEPIMFEYLKKVRLNNKNLRGRNLSQNLR